MTSERKRRIRLGPDAVSGVGIRYRDPLKEADAARGAQGSMCIRTTSPPVPFRAQAKVVFEKDFRKVNGTCGRPEELFGHVGRSGFRVLTETGTEKALITASRKMLMANFAVLEMKQVSGTGPEAGQGDSRSHGKDRRR